MPEQQISHYRVVKKLGAGGMGEVWLAEDTRLNRRVALKLLPEEHTTDPARVQRFQQEAESASGLNHPNILTIHEIGEENGTHFIATEHIEGETLRDRMSKGKLALNTALDVAVQMAAALAAAHEAGIVHRDIKPENVMIRRDGIVKVLDFGLAKLTEAVDSEAPTALQMKTEPGSVMGTASYMSPEQARGQPVDARADIFSLGVVLYEMVAGRAPFQGVNSLEVIGDILRSDPPPLRPQLKDLPEGLLYEVDHIVTKALRKNRDERYQSARDLWIDLKDLREDLLLEKKAGRSSPRVAAATARSTRPLELVVGGVAALAIVAAVAYFFFFDRAPALTDKDTILIADFVNTTGEPIFDGTLRQGLAVQLAQSPFLEIFSDAGMSAALRLMSRSPEERVTKEIAREICLRQGVKAYLAGSIGSLGTSYVLTIQTVDAQTGKEIAREQVQAESKEQVLKAVSQAAGSLRRQLGESLSSIQRFDAPLELTTSSLEALKAYSLGYEHGVRGKYHEAIPFYKRAVEVDPNFAYAYAGLAVQYNNTGQPVLAAEYSRKAYALKDRASELEKLRITTFYYNFVTGELDKQIEALQLHAQTYPRDYRAGVNLGATYVRAGQHEKAVEAYRAAMHLGAKTAVLYGNLGYAYIRLNRFAEAREVFEQALQQKLDDSNTRSGLYRVGFMNGDAGLMQQQVDWTLGQPNEYEGLLWQAASTSFEGKLGRSLELRRRAVEMAAASRNKETAAEYLAQGALLAAVLGRCGSVRKDAEQALALERNQESLPPSVLALALCGEAAGARILMRDLDGRYPTHTIVQSVWLPTIRAAVAHRANNPKEAIQELEKAERYEASELNDFFPPYLRGEAYSKNGEGESAAKEFQKILDHRGWSSMSVLYPLAHLGLARAAALSGDVAKSRKAYEDFLALWKDADADLPPLIEAKREYQKLQ